MLINLLLFVKNFSNPTFFTSNSPDSSEIMSWKELSHRKPDWVEDPVLTNYVIDDTEEEDPAEFLYEYQSNLRKFR